MSKVTDSLISLKIDGKTKQEARQTLEDLGLDLSSGIKLFLRNVIITQSIPFNLRTKNGFTLAQEEMMLKEVKEALEKGKGYQSAKDLHADILADEV